MSHERTVFDVCAAISRGAILHGSVTPNFGEYGVIRCSDALDALSGDPCADAWVGACKRSGSPAARFSREDAELRARGMSGSSWDGTAYEALPYPEKPLRASVGPHAVAGESPGSRFACFDWTSGPGEMVLASHAFRRNLETEIEADWSAYGAAVAFVGLVGVDAARASLARGA